MNQQSLAEEHGNRCTRFGSASEMVKDKHDFEITLQLVFFEEWCNSYVGHNDGENYFQ